MKQSLFTSLFIFISVVCANAQTESINQYESGVEAQLYAEANTIGEYAREESSPIVQSEQQVPFDYK